MIQIKHFVCFQAKPQEAAKGVGTAAKWASASPLVPSHSLESRFQQSSSGTRCSSRTFGVLACVLAFLFVLPCLSLELYAAAGQTKTDAASAGLTGQALSGGKPLDGVSIAIENLSTHVKLQVVSDPMGHFELSNISAGNYRLEARKDGYKLFYLRALPLVAGDTATSTIRMEAGDSAQLTEGEADSVVSKAGTKLGGKEMEDIPANQRNVVNSAQLTAGANEGNSNNSANTTTAGAQHSSTSVSVGGQMEYFNNITYDGIDDNERSFVGMPIHPSVDAVGGAVIVASSYPASLGGALGGVFAISSKAGTKHYHGAVFEYLRNDKLDTYPYQFGLQARKPEVRQNQFGGNVGGPIWGKRTYFFADYEGFRLVQGPIPTLYTVPTAYEHNNPGDFSDQVGGSKLAASQIDQAGLAYFKLYPLPNVGTHQYLASAPNRDSSNVGDVRIDRTIGKSDKVFGRFSINREENTMADPFPAVQEYGIIVHPEASYLAATSKMNGTGTALSYLHNFGPKASLLLKGGYSLADTRVLSLDNDVAVNTAFGQPGINVPGIGQSSSGISNAIVLSTASLGDSSYNHPGLSTQEAFDYNGTFNWTHKNHAITAGAGIIRRHIEQAMFTYNLGMWVFMDLPSLVTGSFVTTSRDLFLTIPHYRTWAEEAFVSDEWKALPNLTITTGLRYDLFGEPTETNNLLANFDFKTGALLLPGQNGVSASANVNADKRSVGPRLGFNWSPNKSTSIHGGFGMVYFYPSDENLFISPPNNYSYGSCGMSSPCPVGYSKFINGYPTPSTPSTTKLKGSIGGMRQPNVRNQYMEQFNLGIDRSLTHHDDISISYVGALGRQLTRQFPDVNAPPPNTAQDYSSLRPYYSKDPELDQIAEIADGGSSTYNAMQATYLHKSRYGFSSSANFTYAHALDNACPFFCSLMNDGFGTVPSQSAMIDKGNSSIDIREHFNATIQYKLPLGQSSTGRRALLEKGWQANALGVWGTGLPFTVINGTSISNTLSGRSGDRPNVSGKVKLSNPGTKKFFNTDAFSSQASGTLGNERRYQYEGPNTRHLDVSLFKDFDLPEMVKLQFRTEAYNVLNMATFSAPDSSMTSQTFGELTSITTGYTPRQIQFALRLQF